MRAPRHIHYLFHRPGKGTTEYHERLLVDEPDVKILLHERYHGRALRVAHGLILEPSAPLIWFLFPGRWYEIARFHRADESFTGWYTNLCTPVEFDGDVWSTTDLFLDHWLGVSGDACWLDEDELEGALHAGLIDGPTAQRLAGERETIDSCVANRTWPPPIARQFDLARARAPEGN